MGSKRWISIRISYGLSFSALIVASLMAYFKGNSIETIFRKAIIDFLIFGILGYIVGWFVSWITRSELSFVYEDREEDDDDRGTVEGL